MNDFPPHMPYVRRGTIASDAVTPETGRTDYAATTDKVESPVKGLVVSQTFVDMSRFIGPVTFATTRVVMVLTGRLVVRHPDGVQTAKPGDVMILHRDVRYHIEPGSISGQTVNIDITASYMTRCGLEEGNLAQAVYSSPGTNLVVLRLAYGSRHRSDGSLTSSGALITQWMSSSLCNRQMLESRWAKRLRDDMHIHWNETRDPQGIGRHCRLPSSDRREVFPSVLRMHAARIHASTQSGARYPLSHGHRTFRDRYCTLVRVLRSQSPDPNLAPAYWNDAC
ncbi:hypothetical protein ACVWWJ_001990 [Luteibacter sp. HA06]